MKIAYIGIDLFYTALKSLVDRGCEIGEIFTCKTDNVTEFNTKVCGYAKEHSIPFKLSRITYEDIERLKNENYDFAICAGYYFKIPADTGFPIVNIHPSLLPVGRGSWPMPQTILKGMEKSGVTIHKIAEGFDTGDILMQREFNLTEGETLDTFMEKVYGLIPPMIDELVQNFDRLYTGAQPQGEGDYWEAPTDADMTVTADMTAGQADRILRAFLGYECIYKSVEKNLKIIGGRAHRGTPATDKSNILPVMDGYIEYLSQTKSI